MRATAAVSLDDGDQVHAYYLPGHELPMQYREPVKVRPSIHVHIGDDLDIWGTPEVVLRTLCVALAHAREAEAAGSEEITDLGGSA